MQLWRLAGRRCGVWRGGGKKTAIVSVANRLKDDSESLVVLFFRLSNIFCCSYPCFSSRFPCFIRFPSVLLFFVFPLFLLPWSNCFWRGRWAGGGRGSEPLNHCRELVITGAASAVGQVPSQAFVQRSEVPTHRRPGTCTPPVTHPPANPQFSAGRAHRARERRPRKAPKPGLFVIGKAPSRNTGSGHQAHSSPGQRGVQGEVPTTSTMCAGAGPSVPGYNRAGRTERTERRIVVTSRGPLAAPLFFLVTSNSCLVEPMAKST